jgi:arabinofuranosyltransferase
VPPYLTRRLLYAIGLMIYLLVFFKNAWVGDDAFILFRSLDQLLDGHGPRWNPHERVQVFTCPLWYWLLAAMGSVYRNHYLNSILLSAFCNGLLLWNLHKIFANSRIWLLAILMLVFSQAYFDFTSSGLENPLAYCLIGFIARFSLNREQIPEDKALLLTAIACGLLLVTRHDLLLFVLPLLAHRFWPRQQQNLALPLMALLLPLACWTLFSLIYYGFPFPNTAYAKLGNTVPHALLLQRGITYFTTSILRDFISVAVLPVGVLAGLFMPLQNKTLRLLALGIALHLFYVLWIGGDFMRGRFFGWDYLLCVIVLLYPLADVTYNGWFNRTNITTAFAATAAAISLMLWEPPVVTPLHWGAEPFKMGDSADGVTQERHFFYWFTAFWKSLPSATPLLRNHGWCQDGLEQRRQNIPVAASRTVGMHGFCLGTDKVLVDMLGITDPLLARMPHNPSQKNWRPGHFLRLLPAGYCASIRYGDNRITDQAIAAYYDKIRMLTQSTPLLSPERLAAIWQMNTGAYRQEIAAIQTSMTQQYVQGDGAAAQTAAQQDCPFIELPPELIKQLRNGSVQESFKQ